MGLSGDADPRRSGLAAVMAVIDHAGVPMALLDPACMVIEANSAFGLACGRPAAELIGADLSRWLISEDRASVEQMVSAMAGGSAGGGPDAIDARIVGADGAVRAMHLHLGTLEPARPGEATGVLCIGHDRTAERRRERRERADRVRETTVDTTDAATGLPNRRGLDIALASAARRSAANNSLYALLRCEISEAGTAGAPADPDDPDDPDDRAVMGCVDRVRQRLRPADTVARVSPEVLMVIAEDLRDEQDAAGVAYRLLSTVVEPVVTKHGSTTLRMVVGVGMADGCTPPHALAAATAEAADDAREPGGFRLMDLRDLGN